MTAHQHINHYVCNLSHNIFEHTIDAWLSDYNKKRFMRPITQHLRIIDTFTAGGGPLLSRPKKVDKFNLCLLVQKSWHWNVRKKLINLIYAFLSKRAGTRNLCFDITFYSPLKPENFAISKLQCTTGLLPHEVHYTTLNFAISKLQCTTGLLPHEAH